MVYSANKLPLYPADATAFNTPGIGCISTAISAIVTEERNGAYVLNITCYPSADMVSFGVYPRPNMIVLAKPNPQDDLQPFRISNIKLDIEGRLEVTAPHISYDLCRRVVYASGSPKTLQGWLDYFNETRAPFVFSTDIVSDATLALPIPMPVRSVLGGASGSLLEKFGGEFRWEGRNVQLLRNRGTGTWRVRYGSNMTALDYRLTNENSYNAFYAYWRRGDEVVAGYNSVQSYVGDADGNTSGDAVYNTFDRVVIDVTDQFEDRPTQAEVIAAGRAKLIANFAQSVQANVAISAIDAPGVFGQDWSGLRLCDAVEIYHPIPGYMTAKVICVKYDALKEEYAEVTIGSPKQTLAKRLSNLERQVGVNGAIYNSSHNRNR